MARFICGAGWQGRRHRPARRRVSITKNSTIEVTSEYTVREQKKSLSTQVYRKALRIFTKVGTREDTLEVETNGGTMGIKG